MPRDHLKVEVDISNYPSTKVKLCFKSLKGEYWCTKTTVYEYEKIKSVVLEKTE
ncbi:hypothetical protein [Thermodesulfatator autotrophicus]|uniref:hypothetical protein n=1 Tax=Thermodesulfatator autotrophicus TaxID=1795632 RepID=UPI0012FAF124|nr:hypothetical protein [Thermodesulfatator autotrophicus]